MKRGIVIALAFALTACGGGGGDSDGDAANGAGDLDAVRADLEQTYRTYIDAFMSGDGATAYDLLSERCKKKEPLSEFAATSEQAASVYGAVDYEIDSVKINGDKGALDATYSVDALNQGNGSTWVLGDDGWRSDKCD